MYNVWQTTATRSRFATLLAIVGRRQNIDAQVAGPEQTPPPAKNAEAIALLRKWLADESGYDETVWPEIERAIEENRSSYRKRFDG